MPSTAANALAPRTCLLVLAVALACAACEGTIRDPGGEARDTTMQSDTASDGNDDVATGVCGDDAAEGNEACDGVDHRGETCLTLGFDGGALSCDAACAFDTSACEGTGPSCGDGIAEGLEACDGADIRGETCATQGFSPGGTVTCTAACELDTSDCTRCGDGVVAGTESCESGQLGDATCESLGFDGGTLRCDGCEYDTSGCTFLSCGNGEVDNGEDCEPGVAIPIGCGDLPNYDSGSLGCLSNCTYDTSACSACGNGAVEGSEVCDANDLDGTTCATAPGGNFDDGTLSCASDCTAFDTSNCTSCGDGDIEGDEECEGSDTNGATCADVPGFYGGTLGCDAGTCRFDTSGCDTCGNGTIESPEACDGSALGGQSCSDIDPTYTGQLSCTDDCQLDTSGCSSPSDSDGDGVNDAADPAPNDPTICGDTDGDGCDDCSIEGMSNPANDGWDEDGDGTCELPLAYECMNGANAASDPYRLESCIIFTHMNDDRALFSAESGNAPALIWNEQLWEVAQGHSLDMCNRGFFDHTNPDGEGPQERVINAGYNIPVGGENISVNLHPSAAQYGWMNEPTCRGHRDAILRPSNTQVGIGYHDCNRSGTGYMWEDHHHITALFQRGSTASSAFCSDPATHCEVPPDPPTTAECPPQLESWGFCPTPDASMLSQWGCPDD